MRPAVILLLMMSIAMLPVRGSAISIRMHTISDLSSCAAAAPPFVPLDIRVMAHMEGPLANGISGAEFYIEGLEGLTGVQIIYNAGPKTNPKIGDPFKPESHPGGPRRRAAFGFQRRVQECRAVSEYELIFTMSLFVTSTPIPSDTRIRIVAADPPGSSKFDCPVVTLCDFPAFTKVCVHGGEFVLNPASEACANPTTEVGEFEPREESWGLIKSLYR